MHALKLCLLTHPNYGSFDHYAELLLKAVQGGVTSVQLRSKTASIEQLTETARQLIELLRPYKVPVIINDNVHLALAVDADGVHLGQSDLSPIEARNLLGESKIIGLSIESFEQLEKANQLTLIDYVAASAVFPSQTKTNCKTIWGLEGLKQFTELSVHPVVAIGGITQSNIASVMAQGASGVAVISAIHDHSDPKLAASELIQELYRGIEDV